MNGIMRIAESLSEELTRRLPRQRKTQRRKLSLLIATMLQVRSANLMELAGGLPIDADRTDMRYQWIELQLRWAIQTLTAEQEKKLTEWVGEDLPWTTREVGAWIEREFSVTYEIRSGLVALLYRLGLEHRKPKTVSCKLDPDKQKEFI